MPPAPPRPPEELEERYEFLEVLGSGAMGAVWKARDRQLDRLLAVKLCLEPGIREVRSRFSREAAGLARVRHPNIVELFDYGLAEAGPYMVMELLEGGPVEQRPPEITPLQALLPVADALEAVHAAGLLHRDIKPANLFWTPGRGTVLLDFGLLKKLDHTTITGTGRVVGTPAFLPPEVVVGRSAGPPADWYALGVTLYELAEGRRPLAMAALVSWAHGGAAPELEFPESGEDSAVAAVVRALMARDPDERPASRKELEVLVRAAERATAPRSAVPARATPAPRSRWAGPGVVLALLVAGGGAALLGPGSPPADPPNPEAASPLPSREPAGPQLDVETLVRSMNRGLEEVQAGIRDHLGNPMAAGDPLAWPDLLERCGVGAFHEWILAGGEPARLSRETRSRLADLDASFFREGLSAPLAPFLELRPFPRPRAADLLPRYAGPRATSSIRNQRVDGWLATAQAAARRVRIEVERSDWEGALPQPQLHDAPVGLLAASVRAEVCRRLRGASEALRQVAHACFREARARPESAPLAALFLRGVLFREGPASMAGFLLLPPERVLGGRPENPAEKSMAAALLWQRNRIRSRFEETMHLGERAALRTRLLEVARSTPRTPLEATLRDRAWMDLLHMPIRVRPHPDPDRKTVQDWTGADFQEVRKLFWPELTDLTQLEILHSFFRLLSVPERAPEVKRAELLAAALELEALAARLKEVEPERAKAARARLATWWEVDGGK